MARNQQNLARDEATASNVGRGFVYPNGVSHISLYQTGPSRDYNRGPSWNRGRGQQYFRGTSGRSDTQYPDSFHNVSETQISSADSSSLIMDQSIHDQGNVAQWSAASDFVQEEAVEMSRWASQSSFQSGQGSSHAVDINQDSPHLQQSFSQMSFPLLPRNPAFQANSEEAVLYSSNSAHFEDFTAIHEDNNAPFSAAEPFGNDTFEPSGGSQQRTPISEDFRYGLFHAGPEEMSFTPAIDGHPTLLPSTVSEASFSSSLLSDQASCPWDGAISYPHSARNSPPFANEPWSGIPLIASSTSPREDPISDLKSLSPRTSRKLPDTYDESSHLARQSVEMDNMARDHPLYQNITPGPDGLYHCPWEGDATCQHKGEKLKCNYDKFVDSHLKPYRCKVPQCENARFSSTACLLRHEREAHAMHGHGDKPFLCTHEGCERGVPGNGFPRHWNLRDHMKRVHNDTGPVPRSNASGSPTPSNTAPTRAARKRKNETMAGVDKEKEPVSNKRAQTSSIAAPSPPPTQQNIVSAEPSLVQQWQQRRMRLVQLVQQLDDPRAPGVMQVLTHAGKELQVLAGTSRRINNAPAMKRTVSQQSGE